MTDDYAARYPCVKCGWCCRRGACAYGTWDAKRKACVFLTEDNLCHRYEWIKTQPGAEWTPAFGAGCSSPMFNDTREAKIRERETQASQRKPDRSVSGSL